MFAISIELMPALAPYEKGVLNLASFRKMNICFTVIAIIELNPVNATMVVHPADYRWSSYQENALGVESRLRTPHGLYTELGSTSSERQARYRELFTAHIGERVLSDVRTATNKGLVLGNDRFKDEVAALTGRRVRTLKRGPKPKNELVRGGQEFLL